MSEFASEVRARARERTTTWRWASETWPAYHAAITRALVAMADAISPSPRP